jgi:hypothetical protein
MIDRVGVRADQLANVGAAVRTQDADMDRIARVQMQFAAKKGDEGN